MENKMIETDLFSKLFYRKYGKGDVLVLIHGFPEDGELWSAITSVLKDAFTLIIPDLPGAGNSGGIDSKVTIDQLATAIKSILDKEGITQAVIAGHSMGGYIAMSFAAQYPEMLKGLSLVHSTATADTEEKKEARRKAIKLLEKGGKEAFVKGMIPNLFSEGFKKANTAIIERQISHAMEMKTESMVSFYNAMINRQDRVKTLSALGVPVQWIIGREDTVVPMPIALQQTTQSGVTFVSVYAEAAHMSMIELPEQLAQDLKVFCRFCYNR